MLKVAIGGLGAVGWVVARALDDARSELRLVAISAAEPDRARARVASFRHPPEVLPLEELADDDEWRFTGIRLPQAGGGR